jgi:hypothetical protein
MSVNLLERANTRLGAFHTPSLSSTTTAVAFLGAMLAISAIHGFWPGESQPMVQTILDSGAIKCLHNEGWRALTAHCDSIGEPIGLTFLTGMPETMLGWALSWLPGVDPWAAHQLLNIILDAVALSGGYLLLRRWTVARGIALIAATTYLVSPSLIGVNGFQFTFTGYTFIPLYLLLFLKGIDQFEQGGRQSVGVAYLLGVTFLMVFTDGYSYATALLLIGCVYLVWLVRGRNATIRQKAASAVTFAVTNLIAVAAYSLYINAPAEPQATLGNFRYYSLDVITMFVPQPRLWWPSHVGYQPPVLRLWGDGGNVYFNYMGYGMILLVGWLLVSGRLLGQQSRPAKEVLPLLAGGLIALFLSFGPALKVNSVVDPKVRVGDVPTSQTVVGLPTKFLFASVPPFSDMRAVFRWSIGSRFVLIFGAAYATNIVWGSGRRGLAAGLILVSAAEVMPAPRLQAALARDQASQVSALRNQAFAEFDALTTSGERVLMLPSLNDFAANAMAPFAGVRTYNVGIDKSYAAARAAWPPGVREAAAKVGQPAGQANRIARVLDKDADAVVICYFSMLEAGKAWPAPFPQKAYFKNQATVLSQDDRFITQRGQWMTVIRLRH